MAVLGHRQKFFNLFLFHLLSTSNDNESSQVTLPGFSISVPVPVIRGLTRFPTIAEVTSAIVGKRVRRFVIIGCNNSQIVYYRPLTVTKWPTNGVIIYRFVSRLLNVNFYWPLCPTVFCFAFCIERKARINGTVIPWTILFHRIPSAKMMKNRIPQS